MPDRVDNRRQGASRTDSHDGAVPTVPSGVPERAGEPLRHSEERLRAAMRAARMGAWDWDMVSGRVVWSPEYAALFGLTPEEHDGTHTFWLARIYPPDMPLLEEYPASALAERQELIVSPEYRVRYADGSLRWHQSAAHVTYAPDGTPLFMSGIGMDINDRKDADAGLHMTLQAAGVGWFGESQTQDIVVCSPEFAAMLGIEPTECTTRTSLANRVLAEDAARIDAVRSEGLSAGRDVVSLPEARYRHADGTWRWLCVTLRPRYEADGSASWATGIAVDVTERKRAEEERERYLQEVQSLNARLQWAMREAHHRIRNSLQVVASMMDMQVTHHGSTVPAAEIRALSQHVRGLAVVHDMLTDQVGHSGAASRLSARDALRRLLPTLEVAVAGRHLAFELDDVLVPAAQASALAIVTNELVANAIKHGRGEITVRLEGGEGGGRLVVEDDGRGFPAGFDPATSALTGLDVVTTLASWDLAGRVEFGAAPRGGARVVVTFRIPAGSP